MPRDGDCVPDRTGLVEEAARRRKVFARYVERRIASYVEDGSLERLVNRLVDERMGQLASLIADRRVASLAREFTGLAAPVDVDAGPIVEAVAGVTGYSVAELLGPRKRAGLAAARHMGFSLVKALRPGLTYPALAKTFGRKCHTTVESGLRHFERDKNREPFASWLSHPSIVALMEQK